MQYIIYTEDRDDGLPIRQANRDAHLEWIKTADGPPVKLLAAGPWLDDDDTMRGSLLIVEADNKEAVITWTQSDPYAKAHLPKSMMIKPFKWVIGAPE